MGKPRVASISIIMPAFNEEPVIEQAVIKTLETFQQAGLEHELIVVNDKSADRTGEVAERIAASQNAVRCIHHRVNQGVGGAFRTGLAAAVMDYVTLVPVDNPLRPEDLDNFLKKLGACDIVVGVRDERLGYPPLARFGSWVYNRVLVPLLFNIGVADANWIHFYRRSIFSEQGITIDYSGITFPVEVLAKARRRRLVIGEVPCPMKRRLHGKATIFRFRTVWRAFRDLIRLSLSLNRKPSG
ncbi:MAG: glycosyltransferase family 2 protein [Candidatus Glassbacteria bacterium]|nr:glycosyltransferase family 2 protein [Candidatus Glassbacteria bacterium]